MRKEIYKKIEKAKKYISEGKLDLALNLLETILKLNYEEVFFEIAKIYSAKFEYSKSVFFMLKIKKSRKLKRLTYLLLFKNYKILKLYEKQVEIFEKIHSNDISKDIIVDLITANLELKKYNNVIKIIKKYKSILDENFTNKIKLDIVENSINISLQLKKYKEVLRIINRYKSILNKNFIDEIKLKIIEKNIDFNLQSNNYDKTLKLINKYNFILNKDFVRKIKLYIVRNKVDTFLQLKKYNFIFSFIRKHKLNEYLTFFKDKIYRQICYDMQKFNVCSDFNNAKKLFKNVYRYIPKEDIKVKNIMLNEYEIAENKIILKSFPRFIQLTLTTKCNSKCIMCKANDGNFHLSNKEVDDFIQIMPYIQILTLQGGEIFLHDRIDEILEEIYKNKIRLNIITNGLLLNEKRIETLLKMNADIFFSIDSPVEETYEKIRINSNFKVLLFNLKLLNKIKQEIKTTSHIVLNMVVMRSNYKDIEKMLDFAKFYDFDEVILRPIEGDANTYENFFEYNVDYNIIKELNDNFDKFNKIADEYGMRLSNCLPRYKEFINFTNVSIIQNNSVCNKEDKNCKNNLKQEVVCDMDKVKNLFCLLPFKKLFISFDYASPNCLCPTDEYDFSINDKTNFILQYWNSKIMKEYRKHMFEYKEKKICQKSCINGSAIDFNERNLVLMESL